MKKIIFILILVLACFSNVYAETSETMNVDIKVSFEGNDTAVVVVPDDDAYATKKPTLTVITDFENAEVKRGNEVIDCTVTNGNVQFVVGASGTYTIKRVNAPANEKVKAKTKYVVPKTGVN